MEQHAGVIPEVYAKHLEEFAFLWGQRRAAVRSPDFTPRDVARLEERVAAQFDALFLPGEAAIDPLAAILAGGDPAAVSAAGYVLLALKSRAAADRVMKAFRQAEAEQLDALRDSLCHGPIELVETDLRAIAVSGPAPQAAVALEALAFHHRPTAGIDRLVELLQHESPQVRCVAWRIMALLEPRNSS
jgi:uncharacterized protein (TIGR02270 family)